jgi:hypothetical protein
MRFGSGSGSSAVSSRRAGEQQTQLIVVLLAVAVVASLGIFLHKVAHPEKPALNTAEERRQFIQSEAPNVKRIALDKVVPFAVSDKIAKEGYQEEDAKDIDNVVIGIVTYTFKNQLGDAVYSQCFGSTPEWTYDSLKAVVGSDMMDAIRAEVIRNYKETLKQARQQRGQRR